MLWQASSSLNVPGPVGSLVLSNLTLSLKAVWQWDRGSHGSTWHRLKRIFLGSSRLLWAVQAGQWSRIDRTGVDREGKQGQSRVDCRETMQAGQGQEQKGDE